MELLRYARVLRRRLWLVLACPALAVTVAGAISMALPPVYQARASVLVRPAQPLAVNDPNTVLLTSDQITNTYATLMTEQPLLERVIKDLGLKVSPADLAKRVSVAPEVNTTILDVTVQDSDPRRARDITNKLVQDFLAEIRTIRRQESSDPHSHSQDILVVVSPAAVPDRPSWPNTRLNLTVALLGGLALAVGLAILLDYLDQSVKSDEDLWERLGLTVMGQIGHSQRSKGHLGELVARIGDSPASESYKALRTNLLFSAVDRKISTVVVTSSGPGEGKSRTAANLAVVLAKAGHATLLVDANFRNPSMHRIFGLTPNTGFSSLIIEDAGSYKGITPVKEIPNLSLLTSGPIPSNPSELLGSASRQKLVGRLLERFTYLIIDTPPVNAVTDASVLAADADATLLVVEHLRTTYSALKQARQALDRVGARTVGVVMNKTRHSAGAYGFANGYYSAPNGAIEVAANDGLRQPSSKTRDWEA